MERTYLSIAKLPDVPGIYLFKKGRTVLYVGKATSLADRVRSYFDDDLIATRGPRIVDMVTKADRVSYEPTATVLEALVREAALIKKYQPRANVEGKDDKTFLYAVITKENLPRVLMTRGKDIDFKNRRTLRGAPVKLSGVFGPFPSGAQLREGLRIIQRVFPFFDTPRPVAYASKNHEAHLEFNRQIGRYPRADGAREYRRTIRKVALFLAGRVKELRRTLERQMRAAAKDERFEDAAILRKQLFALDHLRDVSLIKDENLSILRQAQDEYAKRIEAYDTAHLGGTNAIGVRVVLEGGMPVKKEYRTFRIRGENLRDDLASLKEILARRLRHDEWPLPAAIVIDGGITHKKAAEAVMRDASAPIPVVAVVKDERHRAREVIGARTAGVSEADAVRANAEAHRFSLARHRRARSRALRGKTETKRSGR